MFGRLARLAATLLVAGGIVLTGIGTAASAATDDDTGGTVTWSVRPSDGVAEDDRAWVERELDPEASVTEHLIVTNHSTQDVDFRLTAADGYFTDRGRFNMLASGEESTDAGTWIDVQETVSVASGQSVVVPFTITVPANATPGDHPAGVAASILSKGDGEVGVESRVGFRVMLRVAGELETAVGVVATGDYQGSWNPFEPGVLTTGFAVENTGNTRVGVTPTVTATALFGLISFTPDVEPIEEMAPGETRSSSVEIDGAWPLFVYQVSVEAVPVAVDDTLPVDDVESASASTTVAALPISQAILIAVAVLLLVLFLRERRRKKRDLDRLLAEAREEGRAQASAPADAAPEAASQH